MPAKITFAGENTYISDIRGRLETHVSSRMGTYETDAPRDSGRKRGEDVHSWGQPLRQSLIATTRFVKFLNSILKDGEYCGNRVAVPQLGGKRMGEKILLGLLLVGLQRSLEDCLET